MTTFGDTSVQIGLFALVLVALSIKLLFFTAMVWFVVNGFRVHWGWGVANLLIPGAFLLFSFLHYKESKIPLILITVGLTFLLILLIFARH